MRPHNKLKEVQLKTNKNPERMGKDLTKPHWDQDNL